VAHPGERCCCGEAAEPSIKLDQDAEIEQFRGEVRRFIDTYRPGARTVRKAGVRAPEPDDTATLVRQVNSDISCRRIWTSPGVLTSNLGRRNLTSPRGLIDAGFGPGCPCQRGWSYLGWRQVRPVSEPVEVVADAA
jgi:hypothetical protein